MSLTGLQSMLEAEMQCLVAVSHVSIAHSVLAAAHLLLKAFVHAGGELPKVPKVPQCGRSSSEVPKCVKLLVVGLLAYGISVSAQVQDPEELRAKLLRRKQLIGRDVTTSEIFWVNALQICGPGLLGD